jgi:NDP-sugar pyrophosphorylase family protein
MCDRAVILAGGLGTRLRPFTVVFPKPLMPVGEFPILEIVIRQLRSHRFRHLTLAVNHQAELIRAFFGDGSRWGLKIDYSLEHTPLSTMGPLTLIDDLPNEFLLMNGDILTDLNFRRFCDDHVAAKRYFTVAAARRSHQLDYGVLHVDGGGDLVGFEEKPTTEYLVSMGVYVVDKSVISRIPRGTAYGFDNLMVDLLAGGQQVHVEPHNGYWKDIGRHDDYAEAIADFTGAFRDALLS